MSKIVCLLSKLATCLKFLTVMFLNLSEFGEHLLIQLNKSSLVLKNNLISQLEFDFLRSTCGP